MNRSKARELAFKLIYESEIQKEIRRGHAPDVYHVRGNRRSNHKRIS